MDNNAYDFINDTNKVRRLNEANSVFHLSNSKKIIFVYSAPKVGSTSVVSSLRLFGLKYFDIVHIHDEVMLNVLTHITDITINELILYNKYLGREVYVINIYRTPIERKISAFFEKIGTYHFNNDDSKVNRYNIQKVINRFNNIFPHIATGDHFIDKYNVPIPDKFDFYNKVLVVTQNNIKFITIRLSDSECWGNILTNILGIEIKVVKDYESTNKPIKDLYSNFKKKYLIPKNLLDELLTDKYMKFYYSDGDIQKYYDSWSLKSTNNRDSYTYEQYKLYEEITIENSYIDYIQTDHYFDEGCVCTACNIKRCETASKIRRGIFTNDKVVHSVAKNELLQKRVTKANKINNMIKQTKMKKKDFNSAMLNVVYKINS